MSDFNRGNLLELLRCGDISWLKDKFKSQWERHGQWISPDICNELLDITAKLMLEIIKAEVNDAGCLSRIMDKASFWRM